MIDKKLFRRKIKKKKKLIFRTKNNGQKVKLKKMIIKSRRTKKYQKQSLIKLVILRQKKVIKQ